MPDLLHHSLATRAIFGFYFFLLFNSSLAQAEMAAKVNEILVIGTGTVVSGNIAHARKMAISDALVKGVEEYLMRRLGSAGMMNNFSRIIHDILPRAREEIENFNILAEDQQDKTYKILVQLKVNEQVMEETLRETSLVLAEGPPIKVLFLVSQLRKPGTKDLYWWKDPEINTSLTSTELSLYRIFQERGFHPIDRSVNISEGDYSDEMKVLDLSDGSAMGWGRLFSADIVVYGKCEIVEGTNVSVFLKALDIESGVILSEGSRIEIIKKGPGSADLIMESVESAINHIIKGLIPEITKAFEIERSSIHDMRITLKGLMSFKQFRDFESFIKKDIKGVGLVRQTRVKGNSISISVEFSGTEDKFLDMMIGHENFPFQAEVSKTEEGEIIINISSFLY